MSFSQNPIGQGQAPVTQYCVGCGRGLIATAAICPACGTPVRGAMRAVGGGGKSKTTAVLLAVFLSFWSWLYTYEQDKVKFWTCLGVSLILLPGAYLLPYFQFGGILAALGFWIWAIVGRATTPGEYFSRP